MNKLDSNLVEKKIIEHVTGIKNKLKLDAPSIDGEFCPGNIIESQILVTVIGRLANALQIVIPLGCYPFKDKKTSKQLTIKEAAQILVNVAKKDKNKRE
jgi:hypothetical protein